MANFERTSIAYSGIFYDSADINGLKKWRHVVGGATTNPGILVKDNVTDLPSHVEQMIQAVDCRSGFPISIEIPHSEWSFEEQVDYARWWANSDKFRDNAVIKVPMDPRNPTKAYDVMAQLAEDGVRINATVGLTDGQLNAAAEAMRTSKARGDNYISLFWGRVNEEKALKVDRLVQGELKKYPIKIFKKQELVKQFADEVPDSVQTLKATLTYLGNHSLNTRVIVGSIRDPRQISEAFSNGADIVTVPPKQLEAWMYSKRGVETVEQFNRAYESISDKIKIRE